MAARTGVQLIHHACFLDDEAMQALEARRRRRLGVPGPALPLRHGQRPRRAVGHDAATASSARATADELERQVDGLAASCTRPASGSWPAATSATSGRTTAPTPPSSQRYVELVGHDAGRGDPHRDPQHRRRWSASTSGRSREGCLADLRGASTATRRPTSRVLQRPDRAPGRDEGRRVRVRQPRRLPVTRHRSDAAPRTTRRARTHPLGGRRARAPAARPPRSSTSGTG